MRLHPVLFAPLIAIFASACATSFESADTLSRADLLQPGERRLVPVQEYADGAALAETGEVVLGLASFAPGVAENSRIAPERLERVQAALSKALCRRLARGGFEVDAEGDEPGHRVQVMIVGLEGNNVATTALSRVAGVAVPGPLNPRIPLGIGALGAEGEWLSPEGEQLAAMRWAARNHLASGGGYRTILEGQDGFSDIADAVDLAGDFADAFGDLVTEARADASDAPAEGETPAGACDIYYDMIRAEEGEEEDAGKERN